MYELGQQIDGCYVFVLSLSYVMRYQYHVFVKKKRKSSTHPYWDIFSCALNAHTITTSMRNKAEFSSQNTENIGYFFVNLGKCKMVRIVGKYRKNTGCYDPCKWLKGYSFKTACHTFLEPEELDLEVLVLIEGENPELSGHVRHDDRRGSGGGGRIAP